MCAALYGFRMLNINPDLGQKYKKVLNEGYDSFRMGYTRINLNYFIPDEEADFILQAIDFVSTFGWMFLPHYEFDFEKGVWWNKNE